MREITNLARLRLFMEMLGRQSQEAADIYFTGGVTALLQGWRDTTIDIDIKMLPELDSILRQIPVIKETININVELASPDQFIPELPGWKERRLFIEKQGPISFYHYDPYAQALGKIERGHNQDTLDVENMLRSGLVQPNKLLELFDAIESKLYKFPAIDPKTFRKSVEAVVFKAPA